MGELVGVAGRLAGPAANCSSRTGRLERAPSLSLPSTAPLARAAANAARVRWEMNRLRLSHEP
jgi:hypothetical protein